MKAGKFYRVTYTRKSGFADTFIGEYCGIETQYADCIECAVCDKEGHKRLHQFNIPYTQSSDIAKMTEQLNDLQYETLYFGTACVKKCVIEEL